MAYVIANDILDNEINGFMGAGGTAAYASQVAVDAAAPAVGAVYGVGYGDRGYGQATFTLTPVSVGQTIGGAEWTAMRNALNVCSEHQAGIASATIPPTTVLDPGDLIQAHEIDPPTSDAFDFNSNIATIDSSRFVVDAGKSGTFATTGTSLNTRVGAWGAGAGAIDCEFDYAFGSENAARYFFNSGGEIRIALSHPLGTPQDNDWNASLGTRLGEVRMTHTATTSLGTSALSSALGFYDLTAVYQTIINGINIGTGAYTTNDVLIEAKMIGILGVNGGNGTTLRVRITLTDQHANVFFDSVSGGTAASFSVLRATFLSGIGTPAGSVFNAF